MTHILRLVGIAIATAIVGALGADAAIASPRCAHGYAHAQSYPHGNAHARHGCRHHGWHRHHPRRAHHVHRAHGVRVSYGIPVVPRYYVNQGPALTGPGVMAADIAYVDAPIARGYPYVRLYDGGPYASATTHARYRHARPAGPSVEHADAVIRTIGPNRVDIQLYRKDR